MLPFPFTDNVTITGPDGSSASGLLSGEIEMDRPESSGLGHGETLLAFQRWRDAKLHVSSELPMVEGVLVFSDGSRRSVSVSSLNATQDGHSYSVTLRSG